MFGSNVNHEQGSQDNLHESRTHNENNVTCDFPSFHKTQTTILTNYCLCTCCYKTDIPRSPCNIFKASKCNIGNAVVQEALSNRFSIPTSKEYICKKCDNHLLIEKNANKYVALQIRSVSHKPQQKCIHCNSVPTDNCLTFDKTKYGENTLINQMTENDEQNIICNKCHNTILRKSLVTCLTCGKTVKKMLTLKFDVDKYSLLENTTLEMLKSKRTNHYICNTCQSQLQTKCTCVCFNTDLQTNICKIYNKPGYDFTSFVVS